MGFLIKKYYEALIRNNVKPEVFKVMDDVVVDRYDWLPKISEMLATKEEAERILQLEVKAIPYDLPEPREEDRQKCEEWIERTANELGIKLSM